MDSQKQRRPVQRNRVTSKDGDRASSGERQICLPLSKQQYDDIWDDSAKVRIWIDQMVELRPSFVMPAFTGTTDQLKQPMELLAHGVPLWLIVKVFGHDEMFC